MRKSNEFPHEVRERAVRMVQEHRGEYPSLWAAIESIAPKIGYVSRPCMNGCAGMTLMREPAKASPLPSGSCATRA